MLSNLNWLYETAQSATQLVCFGLWCAGCVVALRHRPRPGATLAAAGFGILALLELIRLVFFLHFVIRRLLGPTGPDYPDVLVLLIIGVQGILYIAGIALVVAGVSRAWAGNSVSRLPFEAFSVETPRPSEERTS